MNSVAQAIRRGSKALAEQQQTNGSFVSLNSVSPTDFSSARVLPATFLTSSILTTLGVLEDTRLTVVKQRGAEFLLGQKSPDWSFNYWTRGSALYAERPYPDDLDDTFCALAALWHADQTLINGKVLAAAAHILIAAEAKPGGPYRTWLADEHASRRWRDIDLAVNANVGYFLSLQKVIVPGIMQLIEQSIRRKKFTSPYYADETVLLYFIARWYDGKRRTALQEIVRERLAIANTPLQAALLSSSWLILGGEPAMCSQTIDLLMQTQDKQGLWPAQAFYIDLVAGGTTQYVGSPALTTSYCLEALQRHNKVAHAVVRTERAAPYAHIVAAIQQEVKAIPYTSLRATVQQIVQRLLRSGNEQQIVLLPYIVANATSAKVPPLILQQLATANLWGWMAYTVYDDFLDGEGQPALLPGAVFCQRRLNGILVATMSRNSAFQQEVQTILDRIDAANSWEIARCRGEVRGNRLYIKHLPSYGNYWQLADRSLGHTIAGLGVLYAAGFEQDAPAVKALRDFFRHYLIARQLNDDAHDWEDDLCAGHINAAGVLVIKQWLSRGNSLAAGIPLDEGRELLQSIMWEHAVDLLAARIFRSTRAARRAITMTNLACNTAPFEALLAPLDRAAQAALDGRQKTLDFVANL